jgi:hypothetical protein
MGMVVWVVAMGVHACVCCACACVLCARGALLYFATFTLIVHLRFAKCINVS